MQTSITNLGLVPPTQAQVQRCQGASPSPKMSRGKPKTLNAFTNLGLSSGSKLPKAQIKLSSLFGPFNHTFLSTSGDGDGGTGDERLRWGPSKLVQTVGAPRRAAVSRCSLRCRTRPAATAWWRCGACCCSPYRRARGFLFRLTSTATFEREVVLILVVRRLVVSKGRWQAREGRKVASSCEVSRWRWE